MKAVVAGGTGLIGSFLIDWLKRDDEIEAVSAITRRKESKEGKISWQNADLGNPGELEAACRDADLCFCCLGTTMKNAGSKAAFREVDYEYVLNLAQAAKAEGCESFSVVSAMGSDAGSSFFYNRVKGEMERDLEKVGFRSLHIFQPSILVGPRTEKRLGEKLGIIGMKTISPLLIGGMRKYKPIQASQVAKAMWHYAKSPESGIRRFRYDEINSV